MTSLRWILLFVVLSTSLSCFAQLPSGAIYGGYEYFRADTGAVQDSLNLAAFGTGFPPINFGRSQNMHGWNFGLQENFTSYFGGVVDAGGAYINKKTTLSQGGGLTSQLRTRLRIYTVMAGPQFAYSRNRTFKPFVRALAGGAFNTVSVNSLLNNVPQGPELSTDDSGFSFGAGGGTDVRLANHFAVRVAVDYIRTYFFNDSQNNGRGTVSLVYHWGEGGK
jgi:opacity protein-like surface antigen